VNSCESASTIALISEGSADGYQQGYQYGGEQQQQQSENVEVTVHPSELTINRGERAEITCHVKGARDYTVKWGKYAHDTSLPDYAHVCFNSLCVLSHLRSIITIVFSNKEILSS
jgi:hypothetical protein